MVDTVSCLQFHGTFWVSDVSWSWT